MLRKAAKLVFLSLIFCASIFGQASSTSGPGAQSAGASGGGTVSIASLGIVTNGLMAEYQMRPGDSVDALPDYSGNGNNCTTHIGTAPTILSNTGGIQFIGLGAVPCPAALNAALTIQVFADVNINQFITNPGLMVGGTVSPGTGLGAISITTGTNSPTANFGALRIVTGSGCLTCFSGGNQFGIQSRATIGAVPQLITFTMEGNTNGDQIWIGPNKQNTNFYNIDSGTSSAGRQTTGVYSIGGNTTGLAAAGAGYWYGEIWWAAFYNRVLTAAEVAQNYQYVTQLMAKRNITSSSSTVGQRGIDDVVCDGSSITEGFSITTPPCQAMMIAASAGSGTTFQGASFRGNIGIGGANSSTILASLSASLDPYFMPNARNVYIVETGVNDSSAASVAQNFVAIAQHARQLGFKIIFKSMISLSSGIGDSGKNQVNTWGRTIASNPYDNGPNPVFDALSDVGETPLGADGASANANLMVGLHPTQASAYNFITPVDQGAVAFLYGNNNWSVANTYTTTNAAAVAITAASQSTNDMTFTTTLNPNYGDCVVVTGVTPAGYNSTVANFTPGCWFVTSTSNATSFHAFNQTTGLGAGTVFGTAQNPQDQDVDYYAILGGSAAGPIHILRSCLTRSSRPIYRMITNTNASPWVIQPLISTETINGGTSLTTPVASATNHPVIELKPVLVSSSAAGCTWQASVR